MYAQIILTCAIGETLDGVKVDYWKDGKLTKRDATFSLRQSFSDLIERFCFMKNLLFPIFNSYYLTQGERDLIANCQALRALF